MAEAKKAQEKDLNIGMAVLAYILFFIPLLTDAKDDPYVKFHVKQGIVLFISWVAIGIFRMIPVLGWSFITSMLYAGVLVLMLIGVINALQGSKKELPIIGQYALKIKI